ncbi:hypothetical protein TrRE_jg1150, partial [Triparma retinervis]
SDNNSLNRGSRANSEDYNLGVSPSHGSASSGAGTLGTGKGGGAKQHGHEVNRQGSGEYSEILANMQEQEVNMKKIKVKMGRDKEVETDQGNNGGEGDRVKRAHSKRKESLGSHVNVVETDGDNKDNKDVLDLSLIIQLEGKEQRVQFEYHLTLDDPLAVAKEMVTELNVAESEVHEISLTIKRAALEAREKQKAKGRGEQGMPPTVNKESPPLGAIKENGVKGAGKEDGSGSHNDQILPSPPLNLDGIVGPPPVVSVNAGGVGSLNLDDDYASDSSDEELSSLEQEYNQKLQRANKAYTTRMDNLHKSKVEREAQHRKVVEKHERDMADYDKRVKNAEMEQAKRVQELESDWEGKRRAHVERRRAGGGGGGG